MNELIQWFPQLSVLDLQIQPLARLLLTNLNVYGLSLQSLKSESSIFFIYIILGVITKRSVYPLAFFMCYLLVNASMFQHVSEWQIYLMMGVIYSYVFKDCPTKQSKYACVTICLISISLAIDAYLYGVNGYYGTRQTILWENVEYIATCAHLILIGSLVPIERIRNNIRGFITSFGSLASNSDYMLIYCYNVSKAIK